MRLNRFYEELKKEVNLNFIHKINLILNCIDKLNKKCYQPSQNFFIISFWSELNPRGVLDFSPLNYYSHGNYHWQLFSRLKAAKRLKKNNLSLQLVNNLSILN